MYLLATGGTLLHLERPLFAMRVFRAVPLLMFVDALSSHLLFTKFARTARLQPRLRCSRAAAPALFCMQVCGRI